MAITAVSKISLTGLVAGDPRKSQELFDICRTTGFLLLDLSDSPASKAALQSIGTMFGIAASVFSLDEDKIPFKQDALNGKFVG